ncbi:P-type ATPase, subfamily IIA, SERCA-type [Parasponia andersonii]|uniref:P-type ATPase, subfamily IIA, SERCA-type n=1 Tax=Parasponia andersonii TaxID=3476 RepID=A0A2P5E599_PARAD|nr:P-type ATPase, subfamily IIA, SERCA-type [Parasponia andersonii]
MFSSLENTGGQTCEEAGGTGETLSGGVVIAGTTDSSAGEKNSLWFRYVILSISVFISYDHQDEDEDDDHDHDHDHDHEATPAGAAAAAAEEVASEQVLDESSSDQGHHVIDMHIVASDWDSFVRIVKERDLSELQGRGGGEWALSLLQRSHFEENEDNAIDGVQEPQEHWKTGSTQRKGFLCFLLQACNSCTILLLFVSAGLLFAIEFLQQGAKTGWHDGTAVLVAIVVLVASSSVRNFLRERKRLKKVKEYSDMLSVKVERNGESRRVAVSDVKVGDIVHLDKDDQVPGDGLFISGENLKLDELFNSEIDGDKNPFLYAGSSVREGKGSMIVTSIGAETALGEIPSSLISCDGHEEKTLLQALLDKPDDYIEKFGLFMSVLIAFVALIRLLFKKHDNYNELPELKGNVTMKFLMQVFNRLMKPQGRVSILLNTLVAFVIGVQHGMPLVIGVCLIRWKKKLVLTKADPRNLSVCGTIGLIKVIFLDATGSGKLLCKKMEVEEFQVGLKDKSPEPVSDTNQSAVNFDTLHQAINLWVNKPEISFNSNDDLPISCVKSRLGRKEESLDQEFRILQYRRSISSKNSCGVLTKNIGDQEQSLQLHWKGPASTILGMCTHFYDCSGKIHTMENDQEEKFGDVIKEMEKKGLRPIAFAFGQTAVEELKKEGLSLLAIMGLKYPCREDIKSLVATLRSDKISVKLVSEDELPIVKAIAWELGILTAGSDDVVSDGEEIREMAKSDIAKMEKLIIQTTIMGNSHPKDKLLMVEHSQRIGHVVAFYGGLTASDTQALIKADVGITHKEICTKMANKFSDISITDLALTSAIWKKSECVYHNIQKFFQLQLTTWVSGFTITLVSTMHSGDSPLTSLDLIWVNLIMCLLGGLMMVMEFKLGQELLTDYKLVDRTRSLITEFMWKNIAIQVFYQVSLLLIFQFMGNIGLPNMDKDVLKTMIFNTFTLCQLFNLFNAMNLREAEVLGLVLNNYCFLVALTVVMFTQVMLVQLGRSSLSSGRLNVQLWVLCLFFAAFSVAFEWLIKKLSTLIPSSCSSLLSSANSYFGF